MPKIVWQKTPSQALEELTVAYIKAIEDGAHRIAQFWSPQIENYMRQNAPWTDRTGNARQSLFSDVERIVHEMVVIIMDHGMEYGLWLEIRNAGRYAIVTPALDIFAPRVWADVMRMMS